MLSNDQFFSMEIHVFEPAKLGLSFGASLSHTKCMIKVRNENACSSSSSSSSRKFTPILCRRLSKRSERSKSIEKKDLSRILRTEAAIRKIERKANSTKYNSLWPKAVLEALDNAIYSNSWETALKIFELLRIQHWYEPRRQTYTKLIVMLGKCKQPKLAGDLFTTMLSDGLKPGVDVCTALVSAYGRSGLFEKAFSVIDDMKSVYDDDCTPDVVTFSVLLNCCAKRRRHDMFPRILDDMSFLEIEPNGVTYNTLVHSYGDAMMFEAMEGALSDMIESEICRPDVVTMNSVIGAYGNVGRIEEMERWYDEFRVMGVEPDDKTFNVLVRSFGRAEMFEKMSLVVKFMEDRWFFTPDAVTFNTVVEAYGRAGDVESMEYYFKAMKHRGVKPNSITFCSLVGAYGRAGGSVERVDSIIGEAVNADVVLDTAFFNCAISAYGKAGELVKMSQCFLGMKERECCPDHITFATMAQAFSAQGMTEVASDLEKFLASTKDYSEILKFLPT